MRQSMDAANSLAIYNAAKQATVFASAAWADVVAADYLQFANLASSLFYTLAQSDLFFGFATVNYACHAFYQPRSVLIIDCPRAELFDQYDPVPAGIVRQYRNNNPALENFAGKYRAE